MFMCVHVMPSAHRGCIHSCPRNNDRRFNWGVRGLLILNWFYGLLDRSVPGAFLPLYQTFCGVTAQHVVLPRLYKHRTQRISLVPLGVFKIFYKLHIIKLTKHVVGV